MNITTPTGFVITDVIWYTTTHSECIGIVTGHSEHGEYKHYIGVGKGVDEKVDALFIAQTGARFYTK